MCIDHLMQWLRNGFCFSCSMTRGSVCFSGQPHVFQTCVGLNWGGLFWEGVFLASLCLTPPGWALEHTGVWSSSMVMCQMDTAKENWQKGARSSRVELERGGSSIPTQPLQGNCNEIALFHWIRPLFAFWEEEQWLPRILFPSSQIPASHTAAM